MCQRCITVNPAIIQSALYNTFKFRLINLTRFCLKIRCFYFLIEVCNYTVCCRSCCRCNNRSDGCIARIWCQRNTCSCIQTHQIFIISGFYNSCCNFCYLCLFQSFRSIHHCCHTILNRNTLLSKFTKRCGKRYFDVLVSNRIACSCIFDCKCNDCLILSV